MYKLYLPAGHEQPVSVLVQPPVTNLVEAEDALEDQERVFDSLARTLDLVRFFARSASVRAWWRLPFLCVKSFCSRGMLSDHFTLPGVGRVTPYTCLSTVQQVSGLGIERLNDGRQFRLVNHPIHLVEKLFPAGRLAILLETFFGKGLLAHRVAPE